MGILLTTFGLVWLLLIAGAVQFQKAKDDILLSMIVQKTLASSMDDIGKKITAQATKEYTKLVPKIGKRQRSQLHSKYLNISACILENNPEKLRAVRFLLEKLLPILYDGKTFLEKNKRERSLNFKELLDFVFEQAKLHHKKTKPIQRAKELANVQLESPLQPFFYKMMKGSLITQEKRPKLSSEEYYSLFSFICVEHQRNPIVSIYTAPTELLLALFQDKKIVEDLERERKIILAMEKEDAADIAKQRAAHEQMKAKYVTLLPSEVPLGFIDFEIRIAKPDLDESEEVEYGDGDGR